jgi:hypothetical protein
MHLGPTEKRSQKVLDGEGLSGYLGTLLGLGDLSGFDMRSMALAVVGGVLLLFLYGLATRARA